MAKVLVTVCDICQAQVQTTGYEIRSGVRKVVLDLCEEDGTALEDLLAQAPALNVTQGSPAKRRRGGSRVTSMEEIEALKKK